MSYVYLIRSIEYYKIGIANDVESRLAQLQTGNPNELVIESCYEFPNSQAVEAALHQKFVYVRKRGEWFQLTNSDLETFRQICTLLGGIPFVPNSEVSNPEGIEEMQEAMMTDGAKFDYAAMFADGWRIEPFGKEAGKNGKGIYWGWRKRTKDEDKYIYGGAISTLPYLIEEMKKRYNGAK